MGGNKYYETRKGFSLSPAGVPSSVPADLGDRSPGLWDHAVGQRPVAGMAGGTGQHASLPGAGRLPGAARVGQSPGPHNLQCRTPQPRALRHVLDVGLPGRDVHRLRNQESRRAGDHERLFGAIPGQPRGDGGSLALGGRHGHQIRAVFRGHGLHYSLEQHQRRMDRWQRREQDFRRLDSHPAQSALGRGQRVGCRHLWPFGGPGHWQHQERAGCRPSVVVQPDPGRRKRLGGFLHLLGQDQRDRGDGHQLGLWRRAPPEQ